MLDEMTAALPANLTERVLEVIGGLRGSDRSVIFISHRLIEIAAVCDRATVLREGETVGVVDVTEGSEDRIVALMLGDIAKELPGEGDATRGAVFRSPVARAADAVPRIAAKSLSSGTKLRDVSFDLYPGEVLGVVALEGQGQDELFDILAGSERPGGGELLIDGTPAGFRHPADAIRAGLVYVPADRAEALLMQRSVRENIALPFSTRVRNWGLIDVGGERRDVDRAIETLQIDTRAAAEVRRLSGGNQQKVTIARWVAGGVRTMLCFDPTRGIDIGTKQPDLPAAPRSRGRGRGRAALHLGAQGDPARLRPGDRHLRRPGRGRARPPRTPTSRPCSGPPTTCRPMRRCPRRSPRRRSPRARPRRRPRPPRAPSRRRRPSRAGADERAASDAPEAGA